MYPRVRRWSVLLSAAVLPALSQTLFVMPGAGGATSTVSTFSTSSLAAGASLPVSSSGFRAISTLNGSKVYVLTTSSSNSIYSLTSNLQTASPLANFGYPTTNAVLSLDGQTLYIAAGGLHAISTATDTPVTVAAINGALLDLDASLDGAQIFLLASSNGTNILDALSTVTLSVTNSATLPANSTSVTVGPNALVYVMAANTVDEMDPDTYAVLNQYAVTGAPGKPVFTPDGHYLVTANQQPGSTAAVTVIDLFAHKVAGTISSSSLSANAILNSLYAVSGNLVVGLSKSAQMLYDISLSPLSLAPAPYVPAGTQVLAAATTNDIAVGNHSTTSYLFYLAGTSVTRVNLATLTADGTIASPLPEGALSVVQPEAVGLNTNYILYGNNQTVAASTYSEPLVVRVLDANGVPQASVNVAFSGSSSLLFTTPTSNTNPLGYASTTVKVVSGSGAIPVAVSIAGTAASFTINAIAGTGGTGGTGGGSTPGSLEVLAGQGQIVYQYNAVSLAGAPFQVLVKDANGNPVPNQPVTFALTQGVGAMRAFNGIGTINSLTSITVPSDANGIATTDFVGENVPSIPGYDQEIITASLGTLSATIYCTTVTRNFEGSGITIYRILPDYGTTFAGPAGSTIAGAAQFQIISNSGVGIANVGMTLQPPAGADPKTIPSASCAGTPLSNSKGVVTCDAVLNGVLGSSTVTPDIGYFQTSLPVQVTITPGPPALFAKIQGDGQSGKPGQSLPTVLIAQLTDAYGNPLAGQPVTFSVASGSATLSGAGKVTDANGKVEVVVILGKVPGPATITVTGGTGSSAVTATFTETVVVIPGGLNALSGNGQSALDGAAFAQPLVVQAVDNQNNPIPGVTVDFAVTTGSATLSAPSATTDNNGNASVTVTAGSSPGRIVVTATYSGFSETFNLTSNPPGPTGIAFLNAASFVQTGAAPGTVTPGEIVEITGGNLTPGVSGVVAPPPGPLPTSLNGIQVLFGGIPAPIFAAVNANGAEQVNVLVPFELGAATTTTVTITNSNGSATLLNVPVTPYAPAIFQTSVNGSAYAVAIDGTTGQYITTAKPAVPGHSVIIFAGGLGQATPVIASAQPGVAGQTVSAPIAVTLNGVPLSGAAAVYQPQAIGVYLVSFPLPTSLTANTYTLSMSVAPSGGTAVSSEVVQLPVGAAPAQ